MKKSVLLLTILILPCTMIAQGALDALRFSQYRYEGTAKSMAMGNAFTSLGGDTYAISINPASSAVYRYSEFVITPSFDIAAYKSSYLNNTNTDSRRKFALSNIGYVAYYPNNRRSGPVKGFAFGLTHNRLNSYNGKFYSHGSENSSSWLGSLAFNTDGIPNTSLNINDNWNPYYQTNASWRSILAWNSNLLDPLSDDEYIGATENIYDDGHIEVAGPLLQDFERETSGNLAETVFNFGMNIQNILYLGANLSIQSVSYSDFQIYSETAGNSALFQSLFSNFTHTYRQTTSGTGANMKLGAILNPVSGLRIGASISTPTMLYLHDEWDEAIDANYSDGWRTSLDSPVGKYNYNIKTPFRWNIGISYVFNNAGLISVDYEKADYGSIDMTGRGEAHNVFQDEVRYIRENFRTASVLRAGMEIKPISGFALRAGYNLYMNPEKSLGSDMHIVSAGVGITGRQGFFTDLGIQKRLSQREDFSLYSDYGNVLAPVGTHESSNWKILLSLGFRF